MKALSREIAKIVWDQQYQDIVNSAFISQIAVIITFNEALINLRSSVGRITYEEINAVSTTPTV